MRSTGLGRLLPYAAELDFYGSWISIRSGEVKVPGGAGAEQAWRELVGASPKSPGEFVTHLLAKDQGWLAAYFDAVSRAGSTQQSHLVEGTRLKSLYEAYRSAANYSHTAAAASVFPRNAGLLVPLDSPAMAGQRRASGPRESAGLGGDPEPQVRVKQRAHLDKKQPGCGYPGAVAGGVGSLFRC